MTSETLILMEVCDKFDTEIIKVGSKRRSRALTDSRAAICYLMRKYTKNTLKEIGAYIREGYDHTSVIHMVQKAKDYIDTDFEFRHNIEKCEAVISKHMIVETKFCPCCKQVIYDTTA